MNIRNRLKTMESQIIKKAGKSQTVWDFSLTTDEQLLKLEELMVNQDEQEVARYSQQLIDEGFLSYLVFKEKI